MSRPSHSDRTAIFFPTWKDALTHATLPPDLQERYRRAILSFLKYCKQHRTVASVALIRHYLTGITGQLDREALRWFYRAAKASPPPVAAPGAAKSPGPEPGQLDRTPSRTRSVVPSPAARDLGGADWERDLIKAIRERGFLWRTEQTYREWAARFARFLHPRSPYAATAEDIGAFLSALAVEQRAMPSTQRQALNALVFLMQEALKRDLGELQFQRSAPRRRMPTVLTPDECRRLFAQMDGTPRLMAELMYGSGLRLMELLRLRVHHVDLDRGQLKIHGGKGDKDRVTVLPEQLPARLHEQLSEARKLHEADRAAGIAGVWLPEGLERKYPGAGLRYTWQWLFASREPRTEDGGQKAEDGSQKPEMEDRGLWPVVDGPSSAVCGPWSLLPLRSPIRLRSGPEPVERPRSPC